MFLGPYINNGREGLKLLGVRLLQVTGITLYPVRLVRLLRNRRCCPLLLLFVVVVVVFSSLLPLWSAGYGCWPWFDEPVP